MAKKKVKKWYEKGQSLGWSKNDTQSVRRRIALASRKGDALKTARALQALSNITQDFETKRKARADALYFYSIHRRQNR